MENRRPKNNYCMVGSKSDAGCKKHPRHKQAPGVCSVCLGERLSQLSVSSSTNKAYKVNAVSICSSYSSLSSSCYSSSEGSPVRHKYRLASMKHGKVSGLLNGGREDMFRKSKSMAVERVRERGEEKKNKDKNKNKKKIGFWSKLLRPERKKMVY